MAEVQKGAVMEMRIVLLLSVVVLLVSCDYNSPRLTGDIDSDCLRIHPGSLDEILEQYDADYALLIAEDGIAALVSEISFPQIELTRKDGVWYSQADSLPPFCSIDSLREICVFRMQHERSDTLSFQHRILSFERIGSSTKNDYPAWKYRRK